MNEIFQKNKVILIIIGILLIIVFFFLSISKDEIAEQEKPLKEAQEEVVTIEDIEDVVEEEDELSGGDGEEPDDVSLGKEIVGFDEEKFPIYSVGLGLMSPEITDLLPPNPDDFPEAETMPYTGDDIVAIATDDGVTIENLIENLDAMSDEELAEFKADILDLIATLELLIEDVVESMDNMTNEELAEVGPDFTKLISVIERIVELLEGYLESRGI